MRVVIASLIKSLHRALWSNRFFEPERLKHVVDEKGDHHFELTIKSAEAVYTPPPSYRGSSLGHSTGDFMKKPNE